MYVARLRSGGRKHYNMRSVLHRIFWNVHSVLCMSGAAGDGHTIHTKQFVHDYPSRLCGARSGSPQLTLRPGNLWNKWNMR